ncbi:hypothetical protein O988_09644 [Pseudogymnoascus sp. VKM F-3808]|nr:hypothetical protein O988_09644 [Pseudogymnoascus sp. VKM F-3808]
MTNPTLSTSPEMHPAIPDTIAQSLPSQFEAPPPQPRKADRAAAKKESKEAEKARKQAEKEKAKEAERHRKELEQKRKEAQRTQAEALKNAVNASKISAAEDEEKRRREAAAASAAAGNGAQTNGPTAAGENGGGNKKENGFISGLTVNRNRPGAKSMSRRSLGWLKSDSSSSGKGNGNGNGGDDVAVDGDQNVPGVPPIPERLARPAKERFSFSLGRKKSNLTPGQ